MSSGTRFKQSLDQLIGRNDFKKQEVAKIAQKKKETEPLLAQIAEAKELILHGANHVQGNVKFHIEDIVNTALSGVFGNKYTFVIRFEPKAGRTAAVLCLMSGGKEIDPLRSNGGGLVDILTFALRIAIVIISKAPRILVLDEPFKHVSADLRTATYDMMRMLSEKIGMQIIMVTHDKGLIEIADKVIRVKLDGRESVCH